MKKVCGIEMKGNRAIIVALEGSDDDFKVIYANYFELKDSKNQDEVKSFHSKMMEFLEEMDFYVIGIKERISKGRFAGGALSFKMEGLIQLSDYQIHLVHGTKIRNVLKNHDPAFGDIHSYQEEAARIAYYLLLQD